MLQPIFLLSPPRSFSSVVSTIIGQHPQLHTFPELQIFSALTVNELLEAEAKSRRRNRLAPPGLIRELAYQREGDQTEESCLRAWVWLAKNRFLGIDEVFNQLCSFHSSEHCIEKSPANSTSLSILVRILRSFPDAKFIHLTRSAVSSARSIREFLAMKTVTNKPDYFHSNPIMIWYSMHSNIRRFKNFLRPNQYLMIRGEDILAEPFKFLPSLCRWLSVDDSEVSVQSMLKPECSPFSFFGPPEFSGGNDPKFMRSPHFRQRSRKPFSADQLKQYLDAMPSHSLASFINDNNQLADVHARKVHYSLSSLERSLGYFDGLL